MPILVIGGYASDFSPFKVSAKMAYSWANGMGETGIFRSTEIEIVRILHKRMDAEAQLKNL